MCDECSAECRFYASGDSTGETIIDTTGETIIDTTGETIIDNSPKETERLGTWNCTLPPGI